MLEDGADTGAFEETAVYLFEEGGEEGETGELVGRVVVVEEGEEGWEDERPYILDFVPLQFNVVSLRRWDEGNLRTCSPDRTTSTLAPVPNSLLQLSRSSLSSYQSNMALSPPLGRFRSLPVSGLILGCDLKRGGKDLERIW